MHPIRGLLDCYHGVASESELPMEIVLIGDPAKLLPEYPGFRVIESTIPIYTIREQLVLSFVLRGTDLLHVPHYNVPFVFSDRFVVTIHDVAHLALPGIFRNPVKKACARLLLREAARRSRYVITVSRFSKEEIVKYLGINEEKIHVIYNGVAPEFFRNPANRTSGDILPNRGISQPYLLYVGNIKPHKNLERMASAFEKIRKPLIVEDTGFFLDAYKGFPGQHSKWIFQKIGFNGLFKLLEKKTRKAHFYTVICFIDHINILFDMSFSTCVYLLEAFFRLWCIG